jgi:hypothetical protein
VINLGITEVSRARSAGGKDLPDGLVWVYFGTGALVYDYIRAEWYIDGVVERPEGAPIPTTPQLGRS